MPVKWENGKNQFDFVRSKNTTEAGFLRPDETWIE